jgi:RNA polymerase-associated protein CTR9
VAALLGLACCAFQRDSLQEALRLYGRALRQHPAGSPAVRVGLGATLLRMRELSRARAAFQRALELDAGCTEAHVGVALCAAAEEHGDLASALPVLRSAYDLGPQHSPLLLVLSEYAALCSHGAAADAFARAAAENADAPRTRAAASLQLGRQAHAAGRATEAVKHYHAALASAPWDSTPHFGLSQVALARGDVLSAVTHLERAADAVPHGAHMTRRALGHAYMSAADGERTDHAKELLEAACKADPGDATAAVELAALLQQDAPARALSEYQRAVEIRRARGQQPQATLLNNAGVLAARLGNADLARRLYKDALGACGASWISDLDAAAASLDSGARFPSGEAVAATFNLACLEEELGDKQLGAALFDKLRRDAPLDVDVLLRRALTQLSRGDFSAAEALAAEADVAASTTHPDAVALLAGLANARHDHKAAQALLDAFRKGTGGQQAVHSFALDEHIMVCAANALLADALRDAELRTGRYDARLDAEAAARRANRLERALALYTKALARAPRNVYAANGIGAVLAERGRLAEASAVFASVAEAAGDADALSTLAQAVLVNSAHCQLGLGAPAHAVRMYDHAIRKQGCGATDASLLICKARALHDWKGEGDSFLRVARGSLLRALHLSPSDHRARFNVAFVCQEQAVRSLARFRELNPGSEARLGLAEAACDQLHLASRFFKQLIGLEDGGFSFDAKRTQIHAAFCVDSAGKAAAARAQAAREHEAAEARRLAQEIERVAAQQHQQRLLEARETADAVTHEKLEAQAGAARVKLEQAQQRWAATQEAAPEKRRAVQHASLKPDDDGADRAGASTQLSDDAGHGEASGGAGDASGHDGEPAGAPAVKAPRRLKRVGADRHAPEAGDGAPAAVQEGLEDAMEGSPAAKRRATGLSDDDE